MKLIRILMLAVLLALAACSGTATPPIPATGGTSEPSEGRALTLDDNGATIQMKVGETVLLKLGSDTYRWATEVDDPTILSRDIAVLVVRDAQGLYVANAPGTAILTATGTPLCREAQPACAAPGELFRVTVVVE